MLRRKHVSHSAGERRRKLDLCLRTWSVQFSIKGPAHTVRQQRRHCRVNTVIDIHSRMKSLWLSRMWTHPQRAMLAIGCAVVVVPCELTFIYLYRPQTKRLSVHRTVPPTPRTAPSLPRRHSSQAAPPCPWTPQPYPDSTPPVNKRAVQILLECFLVTHIITLVFSSISGGLKVWNHNSEKKWHLESSLHMITCGTGLSMGSSGRI